MPGFNPLRGLGPRRTTHKDNPQFYDLFQSAPRLGAAENVAVTYNDLTNMSFNPLRGLGPRRTDVLKAVVAGLVVSIRSAAWGRGEHRFGYGFPDPADGFNPLRGLGPRRTALL